MSRSEPIPTTTDDISPDDSSAGNSSSGRLFLTLRKTADWHDISPSYLSRRVRAEKAAKGHVLHPYVHFEEAEDEQEKIFGFSFPPDYKPGDSATDGVGQKRSKKSPGRTEGPAGTDSRGQYGQEGRASALGESTPRDIPDSRSDVEDDIADLEEDIEELESTLTHVVNSLGTIAKKLSKVDDRQKQIENEITTPTGEMRKSLRKMRELIDTRFERLNESRMDDSEAVHRQLRGLQDRTHKISEQLRTVVDDTREELEWSREQDLENLSDELQKEIRDPILEILTRDDQSESVGMNALGFGSALILVKILEERPDFLTGAVSTLVSDLGGEAEFLSSLESGEKGRRNSDSTEVQSDDFSENSSSG